MAEKLMTNELCLERKAECQKGLENRIDALTGWVSKLDNRIWFLVVTALFQLVGILVILLKNYGGG